MSEPNPWIEAEAVGAYGDPDAVDLYVWTNALYGREYLTLPETVGSPNPFIRSSKEREPILRCARELINSTALQDVLRACADALDTARDDR